MGCQRAGPTPKSGHLPSGADLAYLWESRAPRTPCQEVDMYTQLGLYIDGEWLNGDNRAGEDVINPANEKVLARLPHATTADIIEWYAEEGKRAYGRIVPGRVKGTRQLVIQEPVGVVTAFTPWNFPTLTPARKIGGALAAGCSIIIKASEETPGSAVELVRCFIDAGVPPGVLNLVFGVPAQVSEHLLRKEEVRKISFTGSVPVGKHLAKLAADGMKRATMELGGHSPVVVFGDVDPEKTADVAAAGKFRN